MADIFPPSAALLRTLRPAFEGLLLKGLQVGNGSGAVKQQS